jgi:nitrate reductase gamma subunit
MHFSRPLYEGLPWVYIALGAGAVAVSYELTDAGVLAVVIGMLGFAALVAGMMILLRRRDFRDLGRHYAGRDDAAENMRERPRRGRDQD